MFGAGSLSGMFSKGKTKSRTKTNMDYWTEEQQKLARGFFGDYLQPRVGKGLPAYEGQLPGTAGPSDVQKGLFADAEKGTGLFSSWARLAGPDEWNKRVAERAATRSSYLKPAREKEDAALKQRAASLGLTSSSDVLKSEMDLGHSRELEDDAFRQGMYDAYEKLGLEVTPQAIESMGKIGEMQRQITEAGLGAHFTEWLRTQPEYSPVIDQILAALGLKGEEQGSSKTSGDAEQWGVEGTSALGF